MALCGLLIRPAMAGPENSQMLVADRAAPYFHVTSGGAYELRVRILNRERDGYPVWVQLPETPLRLNQSQENFDTCSPILFA